MATRSQLFRNAPPCGITILGIALMLQGLFQIFAGIFGVIGIVFLIFDTSRGASLLTHGLISIVLGVCSFIFAMGLFTQRRWAFWAAVIVTVFNLIDSFVVLVQSHFAAWGHIFNLVFALLILSYLLVNTNVRLAFRT